MDDSNRHADERAEEASEKRLRTLFEEAIGRPRKEREDFIQKVRIEEPALVSSLEKLLLAHEETIQDPTAAVTNSENGSSSITSHRSSIKSRNGDIIGPFKILELLGEGGFGEVYLAQQTEPVRRRVALKIIKLGMDTKDVLARFEAERQAVSMMDAPGIARVYEAGATPEGRPYFAMEYVKGEPITDYCDREKLNTTQRLELFIKVCDAIQHAHQKGIIHRDIKPGNILVTIDDRDQPQPKVIDFGIAKATTQQLTEKTLHTQQGMMIGTPEYMSPEQAEMNAANVDTRSDVYSLGVLLYEMLTGTVPFDPYELRKSGLPEIQRIIREDNPPRPSTRLTAVENEEGTRIAEARRTRLVELKSTLRRELEWIPLKALRKARIERYSSAEALGADVRRYLSSEPLEAGPESLRYRASKLIRRYRKTAVTTVVIQMILLAGILTTTYMFNQEKRRNEERNNKILEFLTAMNDFEKKSEDTTDFLEAVTDIKPEFTDPLIQQTIGVYIESMSRLKFARETLFLVDAEDLANEYRKREGNDRVTRKEALDWAESTLVEMVFDPSIEMIANESVNSPELALDKAKTLNTYAVRHHSFPKKYLETAELILDCALRMAPTNPFEIAGAYQRTANALAGLSRFEAAIEAYTRSIEALDMQDSSDKLDLEGKRKMTWYALTGKGSTYNMMNQKELAIQQFTESLKYCSNQPDMGHWSFMQLSKIYSALGRHQEAIDAASNCKYIETFFNEAPISESVDQWRLDFGISILDSLEGIGDVKRAAIVARKLCEATTNNNNARFMSALDGICERANRFTDLDVAQ